MTAELRDQLRAGKRVRIDEIEGFPYDEAQEQASRACDPPCPALPYTMIRPGAALGITQLACTANFVFRSGSELGIGTAGHCTGEGASHETLLVNQGQLGLVHLGTTVFSTGNGGVGDDFALISIDPGLHDHVDPAVSVLDGPCGWRAPNGFADLVQYYGHATVWGAGGQPRSGWVFQDQGSYLQYTRLPAGTGGDSGSPVVFAADGTNLREAAAVHTHGTSSVSVLGGPFGIGTSMERVFEILEDAGLEDWRLVDSPNCP